MEMPMGNRSSQYVTKDGRRERAVRGTDPNPVLKASETRRIPRTPLEVARHRQSALMLDSLGYPEEAQRAVENSRRSLRRAYVELVRQGVI